MRFFCAPVAPPKAANRTIGAIARGIAADAPFFGGGARSALPPKNGAGADSPTAQKKRTDENSSVRFFCGGSPKPKLTKKANKGLGEID